MNQGIHYRHTFRLKRFRRDMDRYFVQVAESDVGYVDYKRDTHGIHWRIDPDNRLRDAIQLSFAEITTGDYKHMSHAEAELERKIRKYIGSEIVDHMPKQAGAVLIWRILPEIVSYGGRHHGYVRLLVLDPRRDKHEGMQ